MKRAPGKSHLRRLLFWRIVWRDTVHYNRDGTAVGVCSSRSPCTHTLRKQREAHAGARLSFSFFLFYPVHKTHLTLGRQSSLLSKHYLKNAFIDTPRNVSSGRFYIQSTMKSKHYTSTQQILNWPFDTTGLGRRRSLTQNHQALPQAVCVHYSTYETTSPHVIEGIILILKKKNLNSVICFSFLFLSFFNGQ